MVNNDFGGGLVLAVVRITARNQLRKIKSQSLY